MEIISIQNQNVLFQNNNVLDADYSFKVVDTL